MTGEVARPVRRIVIPVAGTDREFLAQEQAAEHAAALGVPVYGLHVTPEPDNVDGSMWKFLRQTCDRWGVDLETRALAGTDAAQEILADVDAMDLIVIGTHRLTDRYHFGSVAEAIIRKAPCAVQVIRLD